MIMIDPEMMESSMTEEGEGIHVHDLGADQDLEDDQLELDEINLDDYVDVNLGMPLEEEQLGDENDDLEEDEIKDEDIKEALMVTPT